MRNISGLSLSALFMKHSEIKVENKYRLFLNACQEIFVKYKCLKNPDLKLNQLSLKSYVHTQTKKWTQCVVCILYMYIHI